ncbi:CCR4-NOT transcription complex subunit 9 [Linum grandiflorum]
MNSKQKMPMPEYYGGSSFFSTQPPFFSDPGASSSSTPVWDETMLTVGQLIDALQNPNTKDRALAILGKFTDREMLAPILWNTFGTVNILLAEITTAYRLIDRNFTSQMSTHICHTLALFQGFATHPEIKYLFMRANIPYYLYPFLDSRRTDKPTEFVRLTSLGVIGALVKVEDPITTEFLLESQIFPSCLNSMEYGTHLLSKTVATFIIYKLIATDDGLKYCCTLAERACHALKKYLPARLRDASFLMNLLLREDVTTRMCLKELYENIAKGGKFEAPSPAMGNMVMNLVHQ